MRAMLALNGLMHKYETRNLHHNWKEVALSLEWPEFPKRVGRVEALKMGL